MDQVVITLRGVPEGKGRPRIGRLRDGRPVAFTPASTRSYENALRTMAGAAMRGHPPLEGPVHVHLEARFPIAESWSKKKRAAALAGQVRPTTKPDADNLLKTLDALNEVVWRDDRQIVEALVSKWYSDTPEVVITVSRLPHLYRSSAATSLASTVPIQDSLSLTP